MKPNNAFLAQPKDFWAHVRAISETVGYTIRGENQIKTPTPTEIKGALEKRGLQSGHLFKEHRLPTDYCNTLLNYLDYRANILNSYVEPRLMDVERARHVFDDLYNQYAPQCPIPMNKQSGDKKAPAYFTGSINILIEAYAKGLPCDYNPRKLTVVTRDGIPLRTFSRQIDGAFPSVINPIAVWEIKEYYYTTTFGSRVADAIYETLLDGMEIEELWERERIPIKHYLMVDSHYTWWECGRSYLCRMIDLLHMGYVDEILFGYEIVERLPELVNSWLDVFNTLKTKQ